MDGHTTVEVVSTGFVVVSIVSVTPVLNGGVVGDTGTVTIGAVVVGAVPVVVVGQPCLQEVTTIVEVVRLVRVYVFEFDEYVDVTGQVVRVV